MNITNQQQNELPAVARTDQCPAQYATPLTDLESGQEGYTIRAEMPGVDKTGLEITVDDGELTIVGHRHKEQVSGERLYGEMHQNDFRRVYLLDPAIDATRIVARLDQGILTLSLPKAEQGKPRKITVD